MSVPFTEAEGPTMECGLIGLQGSGKTTLFQALTAHAVEVQVGSMKPNLGIADIPDPRLARIATHIPTQKIVPANLQVVDIPGVPDGGGAAALNAVLSSIRTVDAVCQVVRCWDDPGLGAADPGSHIASLETELVLADLVVAEGGVDKAKRAARSGDRDAKQRLEVLEKSHAMLGDEQPLRTGQWDESEAALLKSYGMITAKPIMYVANVGEDGVAGESAASIAVAEAAAARGGVSVTLCATIESEIAELDESDRGEMLESMGIAEPALGAFARAANELLGLSTFYTAGEKEVRAWSIVQGATAPEAAGAIHSDIQRGFIRAECYHVDELDEYKSEKAIKEAGKLRSEGKGYTMQDGDVVHYLFNV
ncbi:MAG: redox-regulated ATPase YchF [Phycisphaerales bacterium]|nr:redox-regulated ATPase YchF [Phycisphaerales bacterium]